MTKRDFPRLAIEDEDLEGDIAALRSINDRGDPCSFQILSSATLSGFRLVEQFTGPGAEAERDTALAKCPPFSKCGRHHVARNPDDEDRKDPRNWKGAL